MKMLVLFFIFFTHSLFASNLDECINQLYALGDGSGKDYIPDHCYEDFKKVTTSKNTFLSKNDTFEVVAYKNAFFLKNLKTGQVQVTAGKYSKLENIQAIDLDVTKNEIAILLGNYDIGIYSSYILGNVSPLRVIRNQSLTGCIDIKLIGDKVYALNPIEKSILVFDRNANFYGREGEKKLEVITVINEVHTNAVTIDYQNEKLVTIDNTGNILQEYNL
jgi:hypothetical protein